ncbi:hypothetical protein APHAL10511_001347 [Amanita phalloides]|nr:hypothetical protein APHAL10511_001347 [Amanita phalloides]
MASSSSLTNSQRRRAHQKKQQLSRSNSSFLSAIKSIVTAPLTWFAGNDEFEDSKGKRRRLASPLEPMSEGEDRSNRLKRMRVDSPPEDVNQPQMSHTRIAAYLDPPSHVFKPQRAGEHVHPLPRSSSLSIPSPTLQEAPFNSTITTANTVRSTFPPSRNLSRTMSVDPPARMLRREPAMMNIPLHRDVSSETPPRSLVQRELSVPLMPQSSRSSFRLHSSMTPQPLAPTAQRELSEPPALSSLVINPVFVRSPSSQPTESQQRSATGQMVTLGSIADISRSARSIIRQHSSLLPNVSQSSDAQLQRQQSPAEKALHELDIYKTPLLPSRLRLSTETSQPTELDAPSSVPDLFKSRRTSKLVLMHDEKRSMRFGTKGGDSRKVALANDTKPYAGEGGMKKLLTRRKLEIEADEEYRQEVEDILNGEDKIMDSESPGELSSKPGPDSSYSATRTDWLAAASIADRPLNSASSLRVGRDKKRNHIARPKAKLVKPKFSAAFDEDDAMDEGVNDEKGKVITEDVASKAFVFNPPPGFSFLQNNTPSLQGSDDTKELPILSLPFSLTKSQDGKVDSMKLNLPVSFAPATAESKSSFIPQSELSLVEANLTNVSSVVPHFFANSKILSKPMDIAASPLNFKLASTQDTEGRSLSMSPSTVSTDTSHVPRDTEKKLDHAINANIIVNDHPSTLISSIQETTSSLAIASHSTLSQPDVTINMASGTEHAALNSSLSDDTAQGEPRGTMETMDSMSTEGNHPVSELKSAFISNTDTLTGTNKLAPRKPSAEHSLTGGSQRVSGQGFASMSNNDAHKISSAPETVGSLVTGSTPGFVSATARSETEPFKPSFGLTNESMTPKTSFGGFSFQVADATNKNKAQAPVNSVVSLSTTPSEMQPEQKKSAVFTFGGQQPPTLATTSTNPFSFGGGGSVADGVSKPFAFGTSTSGVSLLGRPITPPKAQDQEVQMEESPTRDVQSSDTKSTSLGFSFGQNATSGSLFGAQTNGNVTNSSPFSFGASQSPTTNAFASTAREVKADKPINFAQTSSFPFSPSNKVDVAGAAQSPTNGPFSFGSGATSFAFSSSGNTPNNPFGQPQASSTPGSPATFGASPFSFGPPTSNSAFTFGSSQPASPVSNGSLSLPQPATASSFGSTGFGQSAPSSPFSATSPVAPSAPGAPLFTIGSAPMTTPGAPRQFKKLPTRRGGKR